MRVLVLGSGGREHALAWKIQQSPRCEAVYLHPGNAGTARAGFPTLGPAKTLAEISTKSKELGIELIVIGPETLLHQGYGEDLRAQGFLVVGPDSPAARLETSKAFSKEFMQRAEVPTADFRIYDSEKSLKALKPTEWPQVLKLDGLAAGKGVVIAQSPADIQDFCQRIWRDEEFGKGPHRVVVESFLPGKEVSYLGFCDGKSFIPLASATDYKRVFDGQKGPNTGGMGAISPPPYFTADLEKKIQTQVVHPVLKQLQKEKLDFRGILYIGLMVDAQGNPSVLEFNTRFGDPETQAMMLRLQSDFVTVLAATARQTLGTLPAILWDPRASVYVVACAEGYPGKARSGDTIEGLGEVPHDVFTFFSGVGESEKKLTTQGGRVLGLGTLGKTGEEGRKKVYSALARVGWSGMHYRKDIGLPE